MKKFLAILLAMTLCMSSAAFAEPSVAATDANTLVVGTPEMNGEFIDGFSGSSYDDSIRTMIHGYCSTVEITGGGEYVFNPNVVKSYETSEDEAGNKWREVNGVMPSNSIAKVVYVENYLEEGEPEEAKADVFTRIKLEFVFELNEEIEDPDGKIAAGMAEYVKLGYNGVQGHNKADWTEKDGYYYYTKDGGVVKPGEVTTPLFGYVTFDKTMGNEYQNAQVIINVIAEATQVKNNDEHGPTGAAW